ncbi:MAG: response regulator [Candidatus Eremiobacteraeota bacterium]|nr:response regulator [Candidatus Eremiobacteraeota bacterium]
MADLDDLKVGVLDLDESGRIYYVNRAARQWLGEIRPTLGEMLSPGSSFSGQDLDGVSLSLLDAEGREFPVLFSGQMLANGLQRLSFLPMRRHALEQTRLAVRDRLSMMATLAAGVAHEINNPLAYVMGNLELLATARLDEEEREGLADVREGIGRIRGIVNSLKTLSRAEEDRKVPVDLNEVGQIAGRLGSKEVQFTCQLEYRFGGEPVMVLGDEGKLTQVALNLLINACQSFEQPDKSLNRICLRTWMESEEGWLEVSDNGPGVPVELRRRIFDPFFTTRPVGSGTGLGLSICQGIVQSLGGRVELAESERGACFRVRVPAARALRRAAPAPSKGKLEGLRCLVIDDDPKVAQVFRRLLAKCDCRVALGGVQGLEILRGPDPFDLVICDLMMPDLSGIEVYQAAGERQRQFVFVTGGTFTTEAEDFLRAAAAPVLTKPFDQHQLAEAYRSMR